MLQTYQTKIHHFGLNEKLTSEMYLSEYSKFFGILERKLFIQSYIHGVASTTIKSNFMKTYGITSRQFNSLRMQLDGKTNSFKEKRKLDIEQLKSTIKHLKCFIERKAQQKETQFNKLTKSKTNRSIF